jgi:methylphosphotriester-DNA--protein-cysteine methyltransferase
LHQAQRNGFRPGRREQKALADAYRKHGQRWLGQAKRAHDIGKMKDALEHADSDLEHAQSLYNSVAPFLNGTELAEKVSQERDQAHKNLIAAQQAQEPVSKETP